MIKRVGSYTVEFLHPPVITGYSSVVGKKEAEGPLGKYFDKIFTTQGLVNLLGKRLKLSFSKRPLLVQ